MSKENERRLSPSKARAQSGARHHYRSTKGAWTYRHTEDWETNPETDARRTGSADSA